MRRTVLGSPLNLIAFCLCVIVIGAKFHSPDGRKRRSGRAQKWEIILNFLCVCVCASTEKCDFAIDLQHRVNEQNCVESKMNTFTHIQKAHVSFDLYPDYSYSFRGFFYSASWSWWRLCCCYVNKTNRQTLCYERKLFEGSYFLAESKDFVTTVRTHTSIARCLCCHAF